jgi:hypothetical protein
VIYALVWPKQKAVGSSGYGFFILRWLHSIVWILLALSFYLRSGAVESLRRLADPLAYAGAAFYLIFMATLMSK